MINIIKKEGGHGKTIIDNLNDIYCCSAIRWKSGMRPDFLCSAGIFEML
jgi:hypothetical protein